MYARKTVHTHIQSAGLISYLFGRNFNPSRPKIRGDAPTYARSIEEGVSGGAPRHANQHEQPREGAQQPGQYDEARQTGQVQLS